MAMPNATGGKRPNGLRSEDLSYITGDGVRPRSIGAVMPSAEEGFFDCVAGRSGFAGTRKLRPVTPLRMTM